MREATRPLSIPCAEARLLSLLKHKFKNKLYSLDASTIDRCLNVFPWANANIYKARWQIELFFKWIKQNLKIKSFLGTSRNAVMTQTWIAMCMY